jgi:hypothetical protein
MKMCYETVFDIGHRRTIVVWPVSRSMKRNWYIDLMFQKKRSDIKKTSGSGSAILRLGILLRTVSKTVFKNFLPFQRCPEIFSRLFFPSPIAFHISRGGCTSLKPIIAVCNFRFHIRIFNRTELTLQRLSGSLCW